MEEVTIEVEAEAVAQIGEGEDVAATDHRFKVKGKRIDND